MVTLRLAGPEDAEFVLALRNDPDVRRWFFEPEPVVPETHARWYRETLAGTQRRLYLVIEEGTATPVGYVRFDRTGPDAADVSLAISPTYQGRGYGRDALAQGCRSFQKVEGGRRIVARILAENTISVATFRRAGFVIVSADSFQERAVFVLEFVGTGAGK